MPIDTEAVRKSLLSKFREVTSDRLEKIGLALLALERDPAASAPAEDAARELHTMKGEARMLALPRIGELAHACEDVLKAWREGRASPTVATDLLLRASDLVSTLTDDLGLAEKPNSDVQAMCDELRAAAGVASAAPKAEASAAKPEAPPAKPAREEARPQEPAAGRSIRVAVDALDSMAALSGDLLVEGARAHLCASELAELVQRMNRMGDRWLALGEALAASMLEGAPQLEGLETDLHLLRDDTFRFVRKHADGVNALRGSLERLAGEVADARLVPLSTVFAAFPRAVRDIARQQGKEVELLVANAEVGVDRGILGEVRDAMVHLLRNAVDHGIEPPAHRERAGKPRSGTISISVRADGGVLKVEVDDDGRGIDAQKLREAAVAKGLLSASEAAAISESAAIDLVFLPGFSTSEEVTDLSGRGVGMGAVKQKVETLGGSVLVGRRPGAGTRVVLRLPQSMALMRVLLVRIGADSYGILATDVHAVGRIRARDRITVGDRHAVSFRGRPTTLVDLGPLLKLGAPLHHGGAPPCVFVQHGDDHAAFVVDGFVGEREVAVKPCGGAFLAGAPGIAGAAVLEDGRVAVLLHVPDLMNAVRRSAGRGGVPQVTERRLRILLVDDSPIARATESGLLKALGHRVDEAVDGEDALSKMAMQAFDLVFVDVQMPRMDGIEYTRRVKSDPATAALPVVILSSLAAAEDRRRGLDAGADAYLVKGELSADLLDQTVARLTS